MNRSAKVEDFPIGSLESRAAARILLSQRWSKLTRLQFSHSIRGPWRGEGPEPPDVPKANPRVEGDDGILFLLVYVPHVWIARGEAAPICPGCGAPYRKATDYPNYPLVRHRAECVSVQPAHGHSSILWECERKWLRCVASDDLD
jgi:hypothetical protein